MRFGMGWKQILLHIDRNSNKQIKNWSPFSVVTCRWKVLYLRCLILLLMMLTYNFHVATLYKGAIFSLLATVFTWGQLKSSVRDVINFT